MFTSMLLVFYVFGWANPDMLPNLIYGLYQQWELGIVFLLFFIAGAWVIYPFFVVNKNTTSVSKSEIGKVDITLDALDNLVNNIAMEQEGVVSIDNRLKASEEGLLIDLQAEIYPSNSIPEITNSLQQLVKSYIEDTTGVLVAEVKVLVDEISKGNEKLLK